VIQSRPAGPGVRPQSQQACLSLGNAIRIPACRSVQHSRPAQESSSKFLTAGVPWHSLQNALLSMNQGIRLHGNTACLSNRTLVDASPHQIHQAVREENFAACAGTPVHRVPVACIGYLSLPNQALASRSSPMARNTRCRSPPTVPLITVRMVFV